MIRRRLRVYADSSVFGGVFDEEFERASIEFFAAVRRNRFDLVTSPVVARELREAPAAVRALYDEILPRCDLQPVTAEAEALAQAYLEADILRAQSRTDALHVALATIARCDVLVSWNFRHLVNFYRAPLFSAVNTLHGYPGIALVSPPEVTVDENQSKDV
jgi:predicted nucleic acid-binding protein